MIWRRVDLWATALLVLLLMSSLHMMSGAVQRSEVLGQWFVPLLLFTVLGLVVLVLLVGWNLWQLLRDYRKRVSGSRLTARLVVLFVLLSLAPVSVVYFYSLQFLSRGIDSWFDVQVDNAMDDALALSKVSLDLHKREQLKLSRNLLSNLQDSSQTAVALSVGDMRDASGAIEAALFDLQGRLLGMSHLDPDQLTPYVPDGSVIRQVLDGKDYVGLTPLIGDQLAVRCLVRDPRRRGLMLQTIFAVPESLSALTGNVQDAYEAYRESAYLRRSIKFSFALTLSLVLLLGLFGAAWGAFYTSRRLVKPITDISEVTRAVADGDYDRQLPSPQTDDELAFLVHSFNAMTRRIARARNVADESRRELQAQHEYLETVLGALSSGVMALAPDGRIETANPAAEQILQIPLQQYRGEPIEVLADNSSQLLPFIDRVRQGIGDGVHDARAEIVLYRNEGRQVLLCRNSSMATDVPAAEVGHVLVFDDVTELVRAQRDAAWGEVARRLAHEIKNPLTPIQLSAERLRHKYLKKLPPEDGRVLDRATSTIVQQVEAMKSMVNDFSDYARPSKMQPELLELDPFVAQVIALYEGGRIRVNLVTDAAGVHVEADPVRLRQVLHNLVKNGLESLPDRHGEVNVSTCRRVENDVAFVEIVVQDNGTGFDPEMIGQVFEPYVTSKSKGTGLGLAIVKRIITEHGGIIRAENRPEGGARVVMRLPVKDMPAS